MSRVPQQADTVPSYTPPRGLLIILLDFLRGLLEAIFRSYQSERREWGRECIAYEIRSESASDQQGPADQ
jgi:hypothetical protein